MSNFKQVSTASLQYSADYDDVYVLANYTATESADFKVDRRWPQLLYPYTSSFSIFVCPADASQPRTSDGLFDPDLSPDDADARFYRAAERVNVGYNYLYLAPLLTGQAPQSVPRSLVETPSQTVMYVDSVWSVVAGRPQGGGNYLVVPPCRYSRIGTSWIDTFKEKGVRQDMSIFVVRQGWGAQDSNDFGGAWPWHGGRLNVATVDSSVRSKTVSELAAGCLVRPRWDGWITDPGRYSWDLN